MTIVMETLGAFETAEDFLDHFSVPYDQRVVDVHRLHILQRFHDRLAETDLIEGDKANQRTVISKLLADAYRDFVTSDAKTEKVFKVFQQAEQRTGTAGRTMVPLGQVKGVVRSLEPETRDER